MPNKNYLRGRAHEYKIKREYEKMGWTVLRTAGSHGAFDLISIRSMKWGDFYGPWGRERKFDGEIVLIQCKSGKSAQREKAKLEPLRVKYNGIYSVRVALL